MTSTPIVVMLLTAAVTISSGMPVRGQPPVPTADADILPDWPASQEALVFLWRNGDRVRHPAVTYDDTGNMHYAYALTARGMALYGRHYEMILRGGTFEAQGIGAHLTRAMAASGEMSFEVHVTPPAIAPLSPVRMIAFEGGATAPAIAMAQQGQTLLLRTPAADGEADGWRKVVDLPDANAYHLAVLCASSGTTVFINGQPVHQDDPGSGLPPPEIRSILFGQPDAEHGWAGRLEGVAVFSRLLSADEIARNAQAYRMQVTARPVVPRLRLRGRLTQRSESPTRIEPYSRVLTLFEYRVEAVLEGRFDRETIYVLHWTVMHKKPLPMADRPLGAVYEMDVEPFEAHPQLEPELQSDTLDWDYVSPVFYDVTGL